MIALETAMRMTEILLALAFLQQSAEHIASSRDVRLLYVTRAALSILLLLGINTPWVLLTLALHSLFVLHRYQGPYNGGSDRMCLLILYCMCLSRWLPSEIGAQAAFGYLGVQVILSYFISGQVKIVNQDWRSGQALQDVFSFSAYPVAESLRALADHPRLLWAASWTVMLFEVLFPFSLFNSTVLVLALGVASLFHIANAALFGLNRFVWCWISAYPSILWLQSRFVSGT